SFTFYSPPTTQISTLSLHDALPILCARAGASCALLNDNAIEITARREYRGLVGRLVRPNGNPTPGVIELPGVRIRSIAAGNVGRSEEHTSELQSRENLVCRLLLEKK